MTARDPSGGRGTGPRRGWRMVLGVAALAALLLAAAAFVSAPGPLPPGDPAGFDLLAFFDGTARSDGTITTGFVSTRPFTATFAGRREGEGLVLDETFAFDDGSRRLQRWRLSADGSGVLAGTVETERSDGALGPPVPVAGRMLPGGAVLDYEGFAPGGGRMRLHFRHEMTRRDAETVENRVGVRLVGLPVATSAVTFRRDP